MKRAFAAGILAAAAACATACDGQGGASVELTPSAWQSLAQRHAATIDPSRSTLEIRVGERSVTLPLGNRAGQEVQVIREGSALKIQKLHVTVPDLAVSGGTIVNFEPQLGTQLENELSMPLDASGVSEGYADLLLDGDLRLADGAFADIPTTRIPGEHFSLETSGTDSAVDFALDFAVPASVWSSGGWPAELGDAAFHVVFTVSDR